MPIVARLCLCLCIGIRYYSVPNLLIYFIGSLLKATFRHSAQFSTSVVVVCTMDNIEKTTKV